MAQQAIESYLIIGNNLGSDIDIYTAAIFLFQILTVWNRNQSTRDQSSGICPCGCKIIAMLKTIRIIIISVFNSPEQKQFNQRSLDWFLA